MRALLAWRSRSLLGEVDPLRGPVRCRPVARSRPLASKDYRLGTSVGREVGRIGDVRGRAAGRGRAAVSGVVSRCFRALYWLYRTGFHRAFGYFWGVTAWDRPL